MLGMAGVLGQVLGAFGAGGRDTARTGIPDRGFVPADYGYGTRFSDSHGNANGRGGNHASDANGESDCISRCQSAYRRCDFYVDPDVYPEGEQCGDWDRASNGQSGCRDVDSHSHGDMAIGVRDAREEARNVDEWNGAVTRWFEHSLHKSVCGPQSHLWPDIARACTLLGFKLCRPDWRWKYRPQRQYR